MEKNKVKEIINLIKNSNGMNICIIGENGAGKTSFAKKLLGIDHNNSQGKVNIQANIIFQNPDNNIIEHIVYDDLSFGLINRGLSKEEINIIVNDIASELNLNKLMNRIISTLSGGEKQRVAIAGVAVTKPQLVIFDEVTTMLDPLNKKKVLSLIYQLNKSGITTLSITHDYDEALAADLVIHMQDQVLKNFGPAIDVFLQLEDVEILPEQFKLYLYIHKTTNIPLEVLVKKNIQELVEILWELHSRK